ncbi:hypothetical protein ACH4S8_42340 [Streptomyces sp. NPDC021080]|uniref:hypothetical protein n=1 Tax=Streptomyces sp. NPDC021080 TaxID=3365110 RepID=UPI0037A75652
MSIEAGAVFFSGEAWRDFYRLDEDQKDRVLFVCDQLADGTVRQGDISPYSIRQYPYAAGASSLRLPSDLLVVFVSRRPSRGVDNVEHVIVGLTRVLTSVPTPVQTYRSDRHRAVRGDTPANSGRVARKATNIAVRIAGRRRAHLHAEWVAILAGAPEEGIILSPRRQRLVALGFLLAALRMRLHDWARPAWWPVDWLLRTSSRTNAFITSVVGTQAIYIVDGHGLSGLVTEIWDPCGIAGAALFALARWLRRVRGIELATPETERADE